MKKVGIEDPTLPRFHRLPPDFQSPGFSNFGKLHSSPPIEPGGEKSNNHPHSKFQAHIKKRELLNASLERLQKDTYYQPPENPA